MANEIRSLLDPHIWKSCAGSSVQIPTVDSRVYYFPQGHAEQSSSPVDFSKILCKKPYVLCRIITIKFLANPDTDEVFAKIGLQPFRSAPLDLRSPSSQSSGSSSLTTDIDGDDNKIVSFAKILTPSDANNGGGFSVPRFCADSIFPPLDYKAEPPVQTIYVKDVHGVVWEFRHIYRGTPRRHLLTTGWSKFVNHKKLVAGDSVVFMKNLAGELFVGIRRTARSGGNPDLGRWNCQIPAGVKSEEDFCGDGFSRSGRGRVPPESVLEAAELAGKDLPFEIIYYPRAGSPDFVVKADRVDEAMKLYWTAGIRVKMSVETEDSSRMTWFQGVVSATVVPEYGSWCRSPWRMLQVTWDEPEVLQNVKRVSPWQVESISATSQIQTPFPPSKKLRIPQSPDLLTDGEGTLFLPVTGLTNTMMGHLSSSLFNCNTFPAGMQGARHDTFCVPTRPIFYPNNSHHMSYADNFFGSTMIPKSSHVSTELNIGNTSQSDNSSPQSHSSVHFPDTELSGKQTSNSTTKAGISSFQLFGKIIQTVQPAEGGFGNAGHAEDDVDEGYKETEGVGGHAEDDVVEGYKETEGVGGPLDFSLSFPYKQMYNRLDVHCRRVSTVEACSL